MENSSLKLFWLVGMVILAVAVLVIQVIFSYAYLAPDSFTYFTLARQFHDSGLLFSYSGLDHTTGIHPGFYFLLLPLYLVSGINLPSASLILGWLILIFSAFLIYRSFGLRVATVASLLFLTPYGATLTNNGMESSLLVLSLAIFISFWSKVKPFVLGLILGLIVLSRLDLIFLVGAFFVWYYFSRSFSWRGLGEILGGFSLILISILALNLYFGGSLMPVSGAIKSSFPFLTVDWLANLWRLKIFVLALILLAGYWLYRLINHQKIEPIIPIFLLAIGGLYLYNALFAAGIGAWYGTFPFLVVALVLGLTLRDINLQSWRFSIGTILLIIVGVIISSHYYFIVRQSDWVSPHFTAAQFLDRTASPSVAAGELKDGVFAFYAQLPVYSLTGLANNQEYLKAVKDREVEAYLADKQIEYIVSGGIRSGVQISGGEDLFTKCRGPIYQTEFVEIFKTKNCF